MGLESDPGDQVHCPYCREPFRIPRQPQEEAAPAADEPTRPILPDDLAPVEDPWRRHPLGAGRLRHADEFLQEDLLEPRSLSPFSPSPRPEPSGARPAPGPFPMMELDAPDPPQQLDVPASLPPLELDTPERSPPQPEMLETVLPLGLDEGIPDLAPAEPAPLPAIPLSLEETAPPLEAIPVPEALPVQEPSLAPEPEEEDVPMARLAHPVPVEVEVEECELAEEEEEEVEEGAVSVSPSAPRRDRPAPRRPRVEEPRVELRRPIWMQPARHESPLTRNRIFGGIAVALGPFFLLVVLTGGRLFTDSPYQTAYWALLLLGLALIVGGVIALIRG
jgi:hypothetical protein